MKQGSSPHSSQGAGHRGWSLTLFTKSPEETFRLGEVLGRALVCGDILALTGELGTGKTCLTQGIASGLGVAGDYEITSPTFTLINEYPGRVNLYHMDLYRLAGPRELVGRGFEEYFQGRGVVVVEWAEKAEGLWAETALSIQIVYISGNIRQITLSGEIGREKRFKRALREGGF